MVEREMDGEEIVLALGGDEPYPIEAYKSERSHCSLDPNHFERSLSAQPNHMNFLKRFLNTKPKASDIKWLLGQRLMRRIRRH